MCYKFNGKTKRLVRESVRNDWVKNELRQNFTHENKKC
jgi:hypothetical protein